MPADLEHELFLKCLPDDATVASVRAFFSECKSVRSVKLNKDKETGKCKGSGWIILGRKGDADWIMEEWNGAEMAAGKPIQIERSGSSTWKDAGAMERSVGLACKFGLTCTRPDCTFEHPDGWQSHKLTAAPRVSRGGCRFGIGCARADCFFSHPEGWNPSKGTKKVCKEGRACVFPNCFYAHPYGRSQETEEPSETLKKQKTNVSEAAPDVSGGEMKPRKKSKHVEGTVAVDMEQSVKSTDIPESEEPSKRLKKQKTNLSEAALDVSAGESKPQKKSKHVKGIVAADIEQSVESSAADVIGTDAPKKNQKKNRMPEGKLTLESLTLESLTQFDDVSAKPPWQEKKKKKKKEKKEKKTKKDKVAT